MSSWFNFAVAIGIGLLVGLERERSKGEGPTRRPAGIRTFALAALSGAIALHLGGIVLLAVAELGVIALTALAYARTRETDPGLTTEVGLAATPLLGGLAMADTLLAAALGVCMAVVFAAKAPLHGFVRRVLSEAEFNSGLAIAVATLVIWPQLPDRYLGPLQAINPHAIWLLVILMIGLGTCGQIATRALGSRLGLAIAGFASGFASSTATIAAMAARAASEPASLPAAVAGAMFSSVATFLQLALLLATVSPGTLQLIGPALGAGALAAAAYGLAFIGSGSATRNQAGKAGGSAFSIKASLVLCLTVALIQLLTAALRSWLGANGVLAGAMLAGLVDAHSASISVAALAASGRLEARQALLPILAAVSSNALAKLVMTGSGGSRAFAVRVAPGLLMSLAAAWAVALWTLAD